jgi:hypothetical protein
MGLRRLSSTATNLSSTLPALSTFLLQAHSNYSIARPCILDLLNRLQDINAHVVVLPNDIYVSCLIASCRYPPVNWAILRLWVNLRRPIAVRPLMDQTFSVATSRCEPPGIYGGHEAFYVSGKREWQFAKFL